jgi:hypothetical protein
MVLKFDERALLMSYSSGWIIRKYVVSFPYMILFLQHFFYVGKISDILVS